MDKNRKMALWIAIGIVLGLSLFGLVRITIDKAITNHYEYQDCKLYEELGFCPKSNIDAVCHYIGEKSFVGTCIEFDVVDKISDDCDSGGAYYVINNNSEDINS